MKIKNLEISIEIIGIIILILLTLYLLFQLNSCKKELEYCEDNKIFSPPKNSNT